MGDHRGGPVHWKIALFGDEQAAIARNEKPAIILHKISRGIASGVLAGVILSPDGRHVALVREVSPEESDIWVLELERRILSLIEGGAGDRGGDG